MSFLNQLDQLYENKLQSLQETEQHFVQNVDILCESTDIYEERIDEAAANVLGAIYAMVNADKDPTKTLGTSRAANAKSNYLDQLGKFIAAIQATIDQSSKQTADKQNTLSRVLNAAQFKPEDPAFKKLITVGDTYRAGKVYFVWREKFDDYLRALAAKKDQPQEYEKVKSELAKEIQKIAIKFEKVSGKLGVKLVDRIKAAAPV